MIGFRTPVILLPQSRIPEEALPYILRHELVHFKRKDLWFKSLVILATAIHWFNPVVYLMARAIALQCKISCDAQVVSGTDAAGRNNFNNGKDEFGRTVTNPAGIDLSITAARAIGLGTNESGWIVVTFSDLP